MSEYWMVLPETHQIEVHTKLTRSRYAEQQIFADGQVPSSEVRPAFQIDSAVLFPR